MPHTFDVHASPLSTDQIRKAITTRIYVGLALRLLAAGAGWLAWDNGCPVFIAAVMTTMIVALIQMILDVELQLFQDVEVDECATLLKTCEATPEGQAYRLAVIKQGRKFIDGERSALQDWASSADARAACKKLHGVTIESA